RSGLLRGDRPHFGARFLGAAHAAGEHHAGDEAGSDEEEGEDDASHHETSMRLGGEAAFGSVIVSTPSRRSAVIDAASTGSPSAKVRWNDPWPRSIWWYWRVALSGMPAGREPRIIRRVAVRDR